MKSRILAIIMSIAITITIWGSNELTSCAMEESVDIDLSYLLTEDALVGYANGLAKGVYYSDGYSVINKISSTQIGAGGVTNANVKCRVSVTSIVERQTSTGWAYVTAWTQTNENAYSAMVSKSLTVAKGNWYRVRSSHYAATDVSSSNTSALWMGN